MMTCGSLLAAIMNVKEIVMIALFGYKHSKNTKKEMWGK